MVLDGFSASSIGLRKSAEALTYRLPRRRASTVQLQVLLMLVVGGPLLITGVCMMCGSAAPIAGMVGILLAVMGISMLIWAVASFACHSHIQLTKDNLILTEWLGPFPLRRVRPIGHLRRLQVFRVLGGEWSKPPHNGVLEIVCEGSQSLWFAIGYPCELLSHLAGDLAQRCRLPASEEPRDLPVETQIEGLFLSRVRDEDTFDRPDQPANSRIEVTQQAGGLAVFRVPPGRLPDAIPVIGVLAALLVVFAWFLGDLVFPEPFSFVPPLAILAGAIGGLVHVLRRWTVIAVSGDLLSVLRTGGPLASRERHWQRSAIRELRMDLSPARRRDEEVCTIRVFFHDGSKAGMCWGRDKDELAWLATMLRQALHVPPVVHETAACA